MSESPDKLTIEDAKKMKSTDHPVVNQILALLRENERLREALNAALLPNKHPEKPLREEILERIAEFERTGQTFRLEAEKIRLSDYDFCAGDQWPETPDNAARD